MDLNSKKDITATAARELEISRGHPSPLGTSIIRDGINFSVLSKHAQNVTLVLFDSGGYEPIVEIPLNPIENRTGQIWHVYIKGLEQTVRYCYRIDSEDQKTAMLLLDPYAKAFSGASQWGELYVRPGISPQRPQKNNRRTLIVDDEFDWEGDQPLNIPMADSIIYELHVRGYTRHSSSNVHHPGTFLGLTEKIPYLKALGVTAIELLPINEFEEFENRYHPETGEPLVNFWGYNSIGFFAPKASFAYSGRNSNQVREFKTMVKAFHNAGMEIILDIVFNHTAEGNENGPVYNFKGLDEDIYYLKDSAGHFQNYSGCGNTMNCNHPIVRDLILDCLRYWVTEMHVDGFRFDLASILGRGQDGEVLANPPLLERIAFDPVLANTKIIAEAWDAAGLYQVGCFPSWGRWAEWNGKFRDDIRRFVKGDTDSVGVLASRLSGSADLYEDDGRAPFHGINFITSHDGFTLADLVSYNEKHNEANGEYNRDGTNDNASWNCGAEGLTDDNQTTALRLKQQKNFAALLLLSHGVPMLLGGDEFGRTQMGNNNAYCHDNEISWVNWELPEKNIDLLRFFRLCIEFRKAHSSLRPVKYNGHGENSYEMSWHGVKLNQPDWSKNSHSLGLLFSAAPDDQDIYIIVNAYWEALEFELPNLYTGEIWHLAIDTSKKSPNDVNALGKEKVVENQQKYLVQERSVVVLIAR